MSSPYSFSPLKKERKEIRLISLHPGTLHQDIKCTTSVVSLLDNPKYETLSYVWGDATKTAPIHLNGHEHHSTTNLVTALRYLREGIQEPRVLWIDALCINQFDNIEKSWQVSMMSSIYASCRTGNIWLGPEMDGNDLNHAGWFSLWRMNPGIDIMMQQTLGLIYELAKDKHLDDIYLLDLREGEWDPCDNDPSLALQGINVLLHRPWWERVWVVQEAVLPPKTVVTVGYLQLEWKDFTDAAKNFAKHSGGCCRDVQDRIKGYDRSYLHRFYNAVDPIAVLQIKLQIKRQMKNPPPEHIPDFLEIFYSFCDRKATITKDKFYSLLGLVGESDDVIRPITVDYSISETDMCRQLTTALLKTGSLNVLVGDQSLKTLPNLPSWVKDFTITLTPEVQKYKERNRYMHHRLFHAFQLLNPSIYTKDVEPKFLPDDILALKGVYVDEVKVVVGKPYPDQMVLNTGYIWPWLIALEDSVDDPGDDYDNTFPIKVSEGQNLKEAFWRTMLGEHTFVRRSRSTSDATVAPEGGMLDVTEGIAEVTMEDKTEGLAEISTAKADFMTIRRLERRDLEELVEWLPTMWQNPRHENFTALEGAMLATVVGRGFVIGTNGYFGLVPRETKVGDELWVLHGGRVPFVLRRERDGSDRLRRIVGDCFIHGIMDGEALEADEVVWREILLC
ncbi:hypothetical protein K469DRAFT_706906 [Zopfia rhizophila CBS 207.26]|uniref:Heterokaryon incompatibility domain-containing protein n=1 Tax=Zopfia rhizophila CBS 207.26 TaxID=1314779 RepID=A0A6A6E2T8_9PEZI|nr:hypothetical protein K469DRAFT_706906 [Zopfia rhizophila CBS 207.26]